MLTYTDFSVSCPRLPGKTETLRVYYVRQDDRWLPLPVNICDNGCGLEVCRSCTVRVFQQAASQEPPFPR